MPLERGPFSLQPDTAIAFDAGEYNFSDAAIELQEVTQSHVSGWDWIIQDFGDLASDTFDDLEELDGPGLLLATAYVHDWAEIPNLDSTLTAYDDADQQLGIALAFAPPAAWQEPPGPFEPPGSVLNLTAPTVDVNAFNPGTSGPIGTSNDQPRPTVTIYNFTRLGSANFVEGDTFQIGAYGGAGQTVSVSGTFNGQRLDTTELGVTDELGNFGLQGVMGPGEVGAWHEDYYFDGRLVRSFDFVVTPANG